MAVSGMHNVSAFGPFFRDSQTSVSRQWSDEPGTPRTRASSLLKMWRELEGDHVANPSYRSRGQRIARRGDNGHECDISKDTYDTEARAATRSEIDHDDNNSIVSGQSSDLGEIERERVRQIFQEWMSSGSTGRSPNGFHLSNCSGPQWLGKNECERIREWGQTDSQQRNSQALVRDGGAEDVSRIEQAREGMAVSHCETTACRPIRRLCGRQTLLDLLQRAQYERKAELQGLLEHRPVSNFTYRNRIQALLRGRFLRNETMIPDIRPSSVAARELGLLRQQHTVSWLREGFLSKLEKSASTSTNSAESDSWLSDQKHSKLESTLPERERATNSAIPDFESDADRHGNRREFGRETAVGKQAMHDSGNEEDVSSGNEVHVQEVSSYIDVSQRDVPCNVGSVDTTEGKVLEVKATEQMSTAEGAGIIRGREDINVTIRNEEFSLETDTIHSHYESIIGVSYGEEAAAHTVDMEGNLDVKFDRPVDSVTDIEEWVDTSRDSMARTWKETSGNELLRDTFDNNAAEQDQMQESHDDWPNHDLQEAIDSRLAIPSGEVGDSVGRLNVFYYSDVNNVHSIELRELFSRRRVSGLLRSGFRESLDQVLQSHVERQGHTSAEWELENESSSPSLVDQDQRQQPNGDRAMEATERNSFHPASSFVSTPQPLWDEEMQGASLPHFNLSQHFGTELKVMNELRNNMARLQQRLNSMQSMLEQCMDMQMELQRSVQQEVSSALNRSFLTKGAANRVPLQEESQWDSVRKGICCLCHDSNIDTLLYRCGHMCTCSKCADKLIQDTGKCPMCQAPVVEAVRAHFIQ